MPFRVEGAASAIHLHFPLHPSFELDICPNYMSWDHWHPLLMEEISAPPGTYYINLVNINRFNRINYALPTGDRRIFGTINSSFVWSVKRSRQITCTGKTKELTKPHSEECEGEALAARTFQRKVGYPFGKVGLMHGDTRDGIFCKQLDWKITT